MPGPKPIIAVLHANSKQGTSVVVSLLQTDKFDVKAVVRTAKSANAQLLASKGAEVVAVDQTDAAALRAALDGVYGVFYVTVTLEIALLQAEYEQGKLVADTAAAAGVKVFVFSTLENVEKRTKGKYVVPPFTDKARIADYIMEQHKSMIGIFPALGGFYTVFAGMEHLRPRKDETAVLVFSVPAPGDAPQPWVNPFTAVGPVVAAAFLEPERYRNTVIPVYDEVLTCDQMVKIFTEVTGIKARFQQQRQADLEAHLPPPVAEMLCHAFAYSAEYGHYAPERDMELVHVMNPHAMTWAEFLMKSGYDGTQSEDEIRAKFVQ